MRLAERSVLSPREGEVAELVAEGLTNRQIAEALVITPDTVSRHVKNILAKLGLRRRAQIAAFVASGSPRLAPADPAPSLPEVSERSVAWPAAVFALVLVATVGLGFAAVRRLAEAGPSSGLPSIGQEVFTLDAGNAGAQLWSSPVGDADAVQPTAQGLELDGSRGLAIAVSDAPWLADMLVDTHLQVLGDSGAYMIQVRGCRLDQPGDEFYRVSITPRNGFLEITRLRCVTAQIADVLLPATQKLQPQPPGTRTAVGVALRGDKLSVYAGGRIVAEAEDHATPLPEGGVRVGAYGGGHILVTGLTVRRP